MIVPSAEQIRQAAQNADWMQVVLNQGPPCFHFEAERDRFCLRAQRWAGHDEHHRFVSLATLLDTLSQELERLKQENTELLARSGKPDGERDFSIHAATGGGQL